MSGYIGTKSVTLSTTSANVGGDSTVGGDLTVDTNTLYVDSTNNRVGVGTASPSKDFELGLLKAMRMQTGSTTYDFTPTAGATDQLVLNSSQTAFYDFKMAGTTKVSITTNGITFNGDTAAANALDDYEEGTWTPTDGSGAGLTFTVGAANYVKIGKIVHIQAYITFPSTSSTAAARIAGLPFTSIGSGWAPTILSTNAGGDIKANVRVRESSTEMDIKTISGDVNITNATLTSNWVIFQLTYQTSA